MLCYPLFLNECYTNYWRGGGVLTIVCTRFWSWIVILVKFLLLSIQTRCFILPKGCFLHPHLFLKLFRYLEKWYSMYLVLFFNKYIGFVKQSVCLLFAKTSNINPTVSNIWLFWCCCCLSSINKTNTSHTHTHKEGSVWLAK